MLVGEKSAASAAEGKSYGELAQRRPRILWFFEWCREGESNPQGPKPGGF